MRKGIRRLNRVRKKAFTLIEMLIVVIIIGILMYALLGNKGGADKDMELQQKMGLLAASFNKCVMDVDNAGKNANDLLKATSNFLNGTDMSSNTDDSSIEGAKKYVKGFNYDTKRQQFFTDLGLSQDSVCQDFLDNLTTNVGAKWTLYAWYIPTGVPGNIGRYIDPDYGGFLVCATTSSDKYGEIKVNANKYYVCSILSMDGSKSVGDKTSIIKAFGGDGKTPIDLSAANPTIPNP